MTDRVEKEIYQILDDFHLCGSPNASRLHHSDIQLLVDQIKGIVERHKDIQLIEDFMITFNQTVREKPTIPPTAECMLRLSLINEETIELAEACGSEVISLYGRMLYESSEKIRYLVESKREHLEPNLVGVLDAFKDLQYVTRGGELAFGLKYIEEAAFEEVHISNMSKVCKNQEEANLTVENYKKQGIETVGESKDKNTWLVYRTSDSKVLKSISYKPANLDKFIYNAV